MNNQQVPILKVCCISSVEEAHLAAKYGASAIGLVSSMPSGPGVIPEDLIRDIAAAVPREIATFLLTSSQEPDAIVAQWRRTRVSTIQLCDRMNSDACKTLRRALPGVSLVQVVHVTGVDSVREAVKVSRFVDAILLDSGNTALPVKQLGGTGRVHDWNRSLEIVNAVTVPVFLAGGLRPENVREAVERVRPFGLDVCSGVRTEGHLDESKLCAFAAAAGVCPRS